PGAAGILPALALSWASVLCFGTGLGFALTFPLVILMLVPGAGSRRGARMLLAASPVIALALYAGNLVLTEASRTTTHPPGAMEGVVIPLLIAAWGNKTMALALLPVAGLADLFFGLFVPEPSLIAGAVVLLGVVIAYTRAAADVRRRALALALCALSAYLAVAAARGTFTLVPPAVNHYQYQATAPLILAVAVLAAPLLSGHRWI